MRVAPRAALLAVLVAMLVFALTPATHASASTSGAMLHEINKVRASHGLPSLRSSASLRRTSRGYAGFMLRRDYFGHLSRIRASRRFRRLGEIIAMHRGTRLGIRSTVRRWLKSPPHRAVILSGKFRYAGAGTRAGRFRGRRTRTWVMHFGAR